MQAWSYLAFFKHSTFTISFLRRNRRPDFKLKRALQGILRDRSKTACNQPCSSSKTADSRETPHRFAFVPHLTANETGFLLSFGTGRATSLFITFPSHDVALSSGR